MLMLHSIEGVWMDMCLRYEYGIFIVTKVAKFKSQLHVVEGEAYDLLDATLWIQEQGPNDIIFKLDSKIVVDHFHSHIGDYLKLAYC